MALPTLMRRRGAQKRFLTMFNANLDDLEALGDNYPSQIQLVKLKDKIQQLQVVLEKFRAIQEEIEPLLEDEQLDEFEKENEEFESVYYQTYERAIEIQSRFNATDKIQINDNDDEQSVNTNINDAGLERSELRAININHSSDAVKLPTIQINHFNGTLADWVEFKNMFLSIVDSNSNLNMTTKYYYLKSLLQGEAADIIKALPLTENNYQIAWEALCANYDNAANLKEEHMKAIFNLEKIERESSSKLKTLINDLSKHLRALESLGERVDTWDTIIIFLLKSKLDHKTFRDWEIYCAENDSSIDSFKKFVRNRAILLERIEKTTSKKIESKTANKKMESRTFSTTVENQSMCPVCKESHRLYLCKKFLDLSVNDRINKVKSLRLCFNCLRSNHAVKDCRSSACRHCRLKHNSLLHIDRTETKQEVEPQTEPPLQTHFYQYRNNYVLLSTAIVRVNGVNNKKCSLRALLDSCSQSSFITKECVELLKIPCKVVDIDVASINGNITKVNKMCDINIVARHNKFQTKIQCLVVDSISNPLPSTQIDVSDISIPSNILLADPKFNYPGPIDVLIGASHYLKLLSTGQIELGENKPTLQKTKLGWIVAGNIDVDQGQANINSFKLENSVQTCLEKFWAQEEIPMIKNFGVDEKHVCESYFAEKTKRQSDGRFITSIPLKESPQILGNSKELAIHRFLNLERRLANQPMQRQLYVEFMNEYETLGHMTYVTQTSDDMDDGYYMPHHGVYKESNVSTKLRVVFNASAATTSGVSFNDLQHVGYNIQNNLFDILVRFRLHKFVVSADIKKMYRQILIEPGQRKYQKIVWRNDPREPLATYVLNTVTYGTTSAPFLAVRCLTQLGIENKNPIVANIIKNDFYVDDMLTGFETVEEAKEICEMLIDSLNKAHFKLHKWCSNNESILTSISTEETEEFKFDEHAEHKTLGLVWLNKKDVLSYKADVKLHPQRGITKRLILSVISTIFDPLGLLSPVSTSAKLLMQQLWREKIDWDESVSLSVREKFLNLIKDFKLLLTINVPRRVCRSNDVVWHGFCDASQKAFAACLYAVSNGKGHLLCAKSKIAPIKILTIPKLELCGAVLLCRLVDTVKRSLKLDNMQVIFWTDSTIVLAWLKVSPNSLKVYVGNRVSEIQRSSDVSCWRHVDSKNNPADIASRGANPAVIVNAELWWHGPSWLTKSSECWPQGKQTIVDIPELRSTISCNLTLNSNKIIIIENYSNLDKLKRMVAYLQRFVENCRSNGSRLVGSLKISELYAAEQILIKIAQKDMFGNNMDMVEKRYASLSPFVHDGIVRVGGRLKNANVSFGIKHPILLSGKHHLSKLILQNIHVCNLHAAPLLMMNLSRQKFWITNCKTAAKQIVRKCLKCFKANPKPMQQLMGNLPLERIEASLPFVITGIDYAGPFILRDRRGRGYKTYKSYLCVFVCFTTRAVHLEIVADLTTQGFLTCLKRFASRRGKPNKIYSDNGTNFIGANNLLREFRQFLADNWNIIETELATFGIEWKFNPPHAPHMGGLWEAAVKSTKYYLKRIAGETLLTFEEFNSLIVQIEAVLNSRPLTCISNDPNDLCPLTPAHFLIGRLPTAIPEARLETIPQNRTDRYELVQRLYQQFWKRWSLEYLHTLQEKSKWTKGRGTVKVGDLVIVKDDLLPPLQWRCGRVIQCHPGKDDIIRVVTVQMKNNVTIKRPITKICLVPMDNEEIENISKTETV